MNNRKTSYYLQLLEVFTIGELKSRYKASLLGFLWIILYPLITAIILNFIFGTFIKINTGGIPYFLFVFSGLVFWNFFQQSVALAKDSLIWNRELVVKTAFPKDVIPLSFVLSKIPDFFISLLILLFFYLIAGFSLHSYQILILLTVIPLFLFSAGLSMIISFTNAVFRDFGRIMEFLLMIFFYVTPIIYPDNFIPEKYRIFLLVNPLATLIIFAKNMIFNKKIMIDLFLISLLISFVFFAIGIVFFKKFEKKITDLI